jgi:hypothetical protein
MTPHHGDKSNYTFSKVSDDEVDLRDDQIDLCALIPVGNVKFRPLIRESYALGCSLNILFMRKEPVGRVYQGGDMDNRIKTLLDGLSIPKAEQVVDTTESPLYCLLEDDALVTGLSVETRRLLNAPGTNKQVKLIIQVAVSVMDARSYNVQFLGDE